MDALNQRDHNILRFIERYWHKHYHSPSYQEIGEYVGLSKSNVSKHLEGLEARGYVEIDHGSSRAIRLLRTADGIRFKPNVHTIPLFGFITAGEPFPQPELSTPLEWIDVAWQTLPDARDVFALRVRGNSMVDALVNDGDIVLLRNCKTAQDGDSVAVRLKTDATNPESTLKEFYFEQNQIRLQPRNPTLQAKWYDPDEVEIVGIVIYVLSSRHNHSPRAN